MIEKRRNHAIQKINLFNVGDKVRMLKQRGNFDKEATFTKSIYDWWNYKLALILKDANGNVLIIV
jgi:hypothetical protein